MGLFWVIDCFHSTFQLWDWCLFTLFGNRFYLCCFPISFWMPVCVPFLKNKESQDFLFYLCICLLWAALGFRCFGRPSAGCGEWELYFVAVWRLPVEAASLVEHSSRHTVFSGCRGQALEHGLRSSPAGGIFLDQGLKPCPLHWQLDSYPLHHQGSSVCVCVYVYFLKNEIQNKVCSVYKTLRCPPCIPWDWPCSCKLTLTPSGARALLSRLATPA